MNPPTGHAHAVRLSPVYQPGEKLSGSTTLTRPKETQPQAVEISVLWHTEGKGDEDIAVHFFDRVSQDERAALDFRQPRVFSTVLPNSPLSYEGVLIKIRWCVRLRVFLDPRQATGRRAAVSIGRSPCQPGPCCHERRRTPAVARLAGAASAVALRSNPFSTRFIQPGAIPFVFPAGSRRSATCAQGWRQSGWWGEITGPHGSGKSTLLAALIPRLDSSRASDRFKSRCTTANDRSPGVATALAPSRRAARSLIVDGYEQLWSWNRLLLRRFCRRRRAWADGHGARADGIAAAVCLTAVDQHDRRRGARPLAAGRIARRAGGFGSCACPANGQNLRDALFELYDLYEQRQASQEPTKVNSRAGRGL